MHLIRTLEIRYLRSIYRIRLASLSSVNILSGRNDVGKSNILKALNLFFNGEIDWNQPIDFYRDFSTYRLAQVRRESIKGKQFISVAITFLRPDSYKGSLPPVFRVTRNWYRDSATFSESSNLEAMERKGKLPSSLETAKRFLQIFLNRVHFEYIPAVKDRLYFEHLLSRLQRALLGTPTAADPAISQVATSLAKHIEGKILQLQKDFERATGIKSAIEPPEEFASLFQAFRVSTASNDGNVPLSLRGDGIQARYIPSVLSYISDNSPIFFIWGFEEPENSLEYPKVLDLANDFENVYSKSAQIFVTTHSPALTSLRGEQTTCTRVFKQAERTLIAPVWPHPRDHSQIAALNDEMGLMQIQEELHEEFVRRSNDVSRLQQRVSELADEIAQSQLPLVLTEGPTDTSILQAAVNALRAGAPPEFIIRPADPLLGIPGGGGGGAASLARAIESIHPADNRKAIAVFDRDQEGLSQYNKLSANFQPWNGREDVKVHANGLAYAVLLPVPPGREPQARLSMLSIEFLFPDDILDRRTPQDEGLWLMPPEPQALTVAGRKIPLGGDELQIAPQELMPWLDQVRVIKAGKGVFASQIVPHCQPADFENFEPLLHTIQSILQS